MEANTILLRTVDGLISPEIPYTKYFSQISNWKFN